MNKKINLEFEAHHSGMSRSIEMIEFCNSLPTQFSIDKFGYSDIARELHEYKGFDDKVLQSFLSRNPAGPLTLRMKKFSLNYFEERRTKPGVHDFTLVGRSQKLEGRIDLMDLAWECFFPDGRAFYECHTGYSAKVSDPRNGQPDAEDINRLYMSIDYPLMSLDTGEMLSLMSRPAHPLDHLDLLPGLMWRVAMGEHLFQKFDISPEEISRVCVSTEETRAANGDKLWKFQTREDPLDWRDSYERQLNLDRPDVFFDITPLRERFADPVELADRGMGDDLDKLIKHTLKEFYPERATRGIS